MTPESTPDSQGIPDCSGLPAWIGTLPGAIRALPGGIRPRPGEQIDDVRDRHVDGLVLPEPDDRPACLVERRIGGPVPVDIAAQLGFPVPGVGRRLAAVFGAA